MGQSAEAPASLKRQPVEGVSLLIPCFNAARHLPRLIAAVHAGTQPFSAILCYDDGSTDDTVMVARNLGLEILTGHLNRGVAHARNQLAAAARTDWIHFHDADDLIDARYLEKLTPFCDGPHDVVSCDADWLDESTRKLILEWRYDSGDLSRAPLAHLLTHPMSLNNTLIRRSAWESVGGCDESLEMWEDADVHIRLAHTGARFHHVPEVLTLALRRSDSFSHDYHRSWTCRLAALERYAKWQAPVDVVAALGHEAERAAAELAFYDDRTNSERAIALCRHLGRRPPTSTHPLMSLLKTFFPAYPLLRLQARHRRKSQSPRAY